MCRTIQFTRQLQQSQKQEEAFQDILAFYGDHFESTKHLGEYPNYDISSTGKTGVVITYEVKESRSPNDVFIELCKFENNKRIPSGLSITSADYYAFNFPNSPHFYLIKTSRLKQLLEAKAYKDIHNKNNYLLAIFRKDFFISQCEKI